MTVVSGILEAMKGSPEGRIRQFSDGLVEREDDPVVYPEFMQQNGVAPGASITVEVEERQSRRSRNMRKVASRLVAVEGMAPEEFRRRNRELAALLDAHQEIGRLQGNRLDAAERALGETQALLRATQGEVQRLTTLLNGFSPRS